MFNLEHAKAGAPVQLEDGTEACIIKFDARNPVLPLVVLVGAQDQPMLATNLGYIDALDHHLAMAPMGYCEGKPVHVGDILVTPNGMLANIFPYDDRRDWAGYTWPRKYPETRRFFDRYDAAIANEAIKHGIDNGYLLDPNAQESVIHPQLGRIYGDQAFLEHVVELMAVDMLAIAKRVYSWGRADGEEPVAPFPSDEMFLAKVKP